ncbi:hypothetical protein Tco_0509812 [Tanacetum coccineum]
MNHSTIESDSAFKIFNDDLAHIISPSEYEYVYADDESDSGDLTTDVVEDILGDSTRKLQMSHRGFKLSRSVIVKVQKSESLDKLFSEGCQNPGHLADEVGMCREEMYHVSTKTKTRQKRTKPARDWKEHGKPKPKASAS